MKLMVDFKGRKLLVLPCNWFTGKLYMLRVGEYIRIGQKAYYALVVKA